VTESVASRVSRIYPMGTQRKPLFFENHFFSCCF
jgi:hypothetical protein